MTATISPNAWLRCSPELMRGAWRWCLALSTCLACASVSAAALDTLTSCAAMNSASQGLTALQAECPELEAALAELGLTDTLQEGWRDSLTRDGLNDLIALARRYQTTQPSHAPDLAALPDVLKELVSKQPVQSKSWWQTFKEWLQSLYKDKPQHKDSSWLARWLSKFHPSADVTRALVYVLLGMVVLAAIAVVINELRAAGILKRRDQPTKPQKLSFASLPDHAPASTRDLESAPLHEQPAILLNMLIGRLLDTGRLSVERFLTHRELSNRASFNNGDERERFAQVANLAERLLYGPDNTADEQVLRVVSEGRALLRQLDASRSDAT